MSITQEKNAPLTLRIVGRNLQETVVACDSVHLYAKDGADGRGGGEVGIRKGHAAAMISLGKGKITAFLQGEEIFQTTITDGIATVKENVILVLVSA